MQSNSNSELGTEPVGRLLLRLAMPAICAQLVNMLYNIVDRIFIGHIPDVGADALTGVGVTFPVIMLISAFSALVGMGGAPRASIALGEKKQEQAENILGNCFAALIAISVLLTAFFLIFQRPLLLQFGADQDTIVYATDYLRIYVLGTIFVQIALGMNGFITAQGKAGVAMATVCIGAIINIILDPILIFGFHLGVRGAAIATVLSQMVSAMWVLRFLNSEKTALRLRRRYFKIQKSVLIPCLALGLSPFVMQSTESLLSITFNVSLLEYGGKAAVGAMTILTSLMQIINLPLLGIGQGCQPILGYNYGARQTGRMRQVVRLTAISSLCYSALFWIATMSIPEVLASLFGSDPKLLEITVWAMRIYFAAVFVLGAQNSFQQCFIALGEAKISLLLALLRKIILLIPLILLLPHFFADKLFAVFLAEPVADVLAALTTTVVFQIRFRAILREMEQPRVS